MDLKRLFKRGALLVAANWQLVIIQFIAQTTFHVLLAVPIIGAAVLVAVLRGADLVALVQGSLHDTFATIAGTLRSEPLALAAFVTSFGVVLLGGSVLMFLVKGGTIDVLLAANQSIGPIESAPLMFDGLRGGAQFSAQRFASGCARLFRRYVLLGSFLMLAYGLSAGAYLAFVIYGYRAAGSWIVLIGWTFTAALATALLIAWITLLNLFYLLLQLVVAYDDIGLGRAARAVTGLVRAEFRALAGVFLVVLVLVVAATLASALAWSGVGLIAFVPVVGLAVLPLQMGALLVRGLVFEYLGLTSLGAYLTLYDEHAAARRDQTVRTEPSPTA